MRPATRRWGHWRSPKWHFGRASAIWPRPSTARRSAGLRDGSAGQALRVLTLVAKEQACEHPDKACHPDSCPLASGFYNRLPAARQQAVSEGWLDAAKKRRVALRHGICPYYLGQELMRWADVLVGDVHHLFDSKGQLWGLMFDVQTSAARVRPSAAASATAANDATDAVLCVRNVAPAIFLRQRFAALHSITLFSATLSPPGYAIQLLGLPPNTAWIDVPPAFAAEHLTVRVAAVLSTRYVDRGRSLRQLVAVISQQFDAHPGNYLAFFSSFDYGQGRIAIGAGAAGHPAVAARPAHGRPGATTLPGPL